MSVAGGLAAPAAVPSAHAATPVVTVSSTDADINAFEFADFADQLDPSPDVNDHNFFRFAHHLAPAKESGPSGTSTAFVRQASTIETPAQPPFPVQPVADIALDGLATSAATVGNDDSAGTPVTDSEGSFSTDFSLSQDTPAFFSGFMQSIESDTDSCSHAEVHIDGGAAFTRDFFVSNPGGCDGQAGSTRQKGWAESVTLPAGGYEMSVDYYSEVDDTPDEAHSVSAQTSLSFNLAFMPPTARFTTKLAGSKGTFNAGGSSAGVGNRPLTSYRWTFGDGTKKTTTTPTVSHTYAASPRTAPTYTVSLQVVDSGKAISVPVTHKVLGTATTLAVSKRAGKLKPSGAVSPRRGGHQVAVTLARRVSGRFKVLATHHVTLSSTSHYATSFVRPAPGTCRVTARYAGDATHLASQRVATLAC